MTFIQEFDITVTTNSSGDATAYFPDGTKGVHAVTGKLLSIQHIPDGSNPFSAGADHIFTRERGGAAILTKTDIGGTAYTNAPGQATHDNTGAAQTPVDYNEFSNDRLKLVIAQGGNTKVGRFIARFG